jgi:putative thioredoxin
MAIDVTDATFQTDVLDRSMTQAVVIDLWAPWCGPCRTLGPILEKVTDATNGRVVLVKVNVDENPQISEAFRVQSIPAVFAMQGGVVVNTFVGALPEHEIQAFVDSLGPSPEEQLIEELLAAGDEQSLSQVLQLRPDHEGAIVALGDLYVAADRADDALALLARIPESDATRRVAATARLSTRPADDYEEQLNGLLDRVKTDEDARQEYVDILALMGAEDPRTAAYRKRLTARLF